MTELKTPSDHRSDIPGYYPSHWPCECAGPRRQKVTRAPGLDLQPGEKLTATVRRVDGPRWPAMLIVRDEGELYVQGGTRNNTGNASFGWVEKIDPITLEPLRKSPELPSGGHNWCGAGTVHANGDIYVVNGCYAHRLTPDLDVVAEHRLSVDNAHNGHVIAPDGNLIAKDIQIDPNKRSLFTVLDPDLNVVSEFEFPYNSVGRFSCDPQRDFTHLYVTSSTHIHRLIYRDGQLSADADWSASYMVAGEDQSFAWDSTVGLGSVWFMDMGENSGVKTILEANPIGTGQVWRVAAMQALAPVFRHLRINPRHLPGSPFAPIHTAPQRVFRVSVDDPSDCESFVPFGVPNANIIAPPLFDQERGILVAFDSMNGKIGGWRWHGPGKFEELWVKDFESTNQLTVYSDTGELLVEDLHSGLHWDAVVLDIETGQEKGRCDTGCMRSSGMWYTPGFGRDFYSSSFTGDIIRISVA